MNIKKTIALAAAAAAGVNLSSAQDISVTTDLTWESAYVFRGQQLAKAHFAPSVDVSVADFYFGIWAALPADHLYDNEVDFYAGYSTPVTDLISADVGFTYYTYPDAQDKFFDSAINTFEVYGGLSFELPFSPSVYLFRDFDLKTFTFEVAAGHSFEVADATTADIDVYVGHVAVRGTGNYFYYGTRASLNYHFTDAAAVSASVSWGGSEERWMLNGKSNRIWFGLGVTAGF